MKHTLLLALCCLALLPLQAQKPRPDAFPPMPDTLSPKAVSMASTFEQMDAWDRYPTYPLYLAMMQRFAQRYPHLCTLDTIGTSIKGRLILSLAITANHTDTANRPQFFYSSTIHGDEVTGYYLMLRLCDSLLSSYGSSPRITQLLNRALICINPLANPDGTYYRSDSTVAGSIRYNANHVDLNRNYPDPFGTEPLDPIQPENQAMIQYVSQHHFLLGANLHGGSEVMNYPWDSFTSRQRLNPHAEWWKEVSKRFVDTCRRFDDSRFRDVSTSGYINGGDWYVIHNGRQDYFNHQFNLREITMEVSSAKTLSSERLPHYWNCLSHSLINFIEELFTISDSSTNAAASPLPQPLNAYPNPTRGPVTVASPSAVYHFDLSPLPAGVHILWVEQRPVRIVKY